MCIVRCKSTPPKPLYVRENPVLIVATGQCWSLFEGCILDFRSMCMCVSLLTDMKQEYLDLNGSARATHFESKHFSVQYM